MPNNFEKPLNGAWKLFYAKNSAVSNRAVPATRAELLLSGFERIETEVPCNLETALYDAGLIEDPYFGANPLKMQDYEDVHSFYSLMFDVSDPDGTEYIRFEGIDTFADIYLNGALIASVDNMLIIHEIPLNYLKNGENELLVHIRPTCIEVRKIKLDAGVFALRYNYDSLGVRKAAHSFGWDIMPRIVTSGIWRPVTLVRPAPERFEQAFCFTTEANPQAKKAIIELFYQIKVTSDSLKGLRIRLSGVCKDSHFSAEHEVWHTAGLLYCGIENPYFWWPKNMGDPDLYDVKAELLRGESILDVREFKFGIRTVELDRTSTTDAKGSGEFCFKINGQRMFVMGTNWVPADAFHSRDRKRLPEMLELLNDIGCNAVRCWGGNVYEDDYFYDYCDEHGIAVWQDFAMGCAVYPQNREFCEKLDTEAESIIKRLRNHTSIILWAGDNECDCAYSWGGVTRDPNENILTRRILPEAVNRCDPSRPYLPSSPYLDKQAFSEGFDNVPEQHIWGPRDYFKSSFYTGTIAHFASEMGYHGCCNKESIEKFISIDNIWPWKDNEEWLIHAASPETSKSAPYAYRIELMAKQIKEFFGHIPDTLEAFSIASQISQGEAMKFFIEFFRLGKWRRTGIIWWNLIDGWPQFSDAVVDYYYGKKLAYDFIRRSQQPLCLMMNEPRDWQISLSAANDTPCAINFTYKVTDLENDEIFMSGNTEISAHTTSQISSAPYTMSKKTVYLIEWESASHSGRNHYLSGYPSFDYAQYIKLMQKAGFPEFGV